MIYLLMINSAFLLENTTAKIIPFRTKYKLNKVGSLDIGIAQYNLNNNTQWHMLAAYWIKGPCRIRGFGIFDKTKSRLKFLLTKKTFLPQRVYRLLSNAAKCYVCSFWYLTLGKRLKSNLEISKTCLCNFVYIWIIELI